MTSHSERIDELRIVMKKVQELDNDLAFHSLKEVITYIETRVAEVEKDKSYHNPLYGKVDPYKEVP